MIKKLIHHATRTVGDERGISLIEGIAVMAAIGILLLVTAAVIRSQSSVIVGAETKGTINQRDLYEGKGAQTGGLGNGSQNGSGSAGQGKGSLNGGSQVTVLPNGDVIGPDGTVLTHNSGLPPGTYIRDPQGNWHIRSGEVLGTSTSTDSANPFDLADRAKSILDPLIDLGGLLFGNVGAGISENGYVIVTGKRAWTTISTKIGLGSMLPAGRYLWGTYIAKGIENGAVGSGLMALGIDVWKAAHGEYSSFEEFSGHLGVDILYGLAVGAAIGGLIATVTVASPIIAVGAAALVIGIIGADLMYGGAIKEAGYQAVKGTGEWLGGVTFDLGQRLGFFQ